MEEADCINKLQMGVLLTQRCSEGRNVFDWFNNNLTTNPNRTVEAGSPFSNMSQCHGYKQPATNVSLQPHTFYSQKQRFTR